MANRIEDDFFDQARIMSYKELVSANELAIEKNFNRSLNIKKFIAAVKKFGYNPDSVIFPVLPLNELKTILKSSGEQYKKIETTTAEEH